MVVVQYPEPISIRKARQQEVGRRHAVVTLNGELALSFESAIFDTMVDHVTRQGEEAIETIHVIPEIPRGVTGLEQERQAHGYRPSVHEVEHLLGTYRVQRRAAKVAEGRVVDEQLGAHSVTQLRLASSASAGSR